MSRKFSATGKQALLKCNHTVPAQAAETRLPRARGDTHERRPAAFAAFRASRRQHGQLVNCQFALCGFLRGLAKFMKFMTPRFDPFPSGSITYKPDGAIHTRSRPVS